MKKFLKGWVIVTPDGDTINTTFRKKHFDCIINFITNLNKSNMEDWEDTGEVPYLITWYPMFEDGYKCVKTTLMVD